MKVITESKVSGQVFETELQPNMVEKFTIIADEPRIIFKPHLPIGNVLLAVDGVSVDELSTEEIIERLADYL